MAEASCSRASSCALDLVSPQLAGDAPVAQHDHPIAALAQLGVVGRGDDHRGAVRRRLAGQPVDDRLRLHVDTLGRLVEQQDPRPHPQPLRQDDLLLVAAREAHERRVRCGRADVERADPVVGLRPLAPAPHRPEARLVAAQVGEDEVLAHRQRRHRSRRVPVAGHERHAGGDRRAGPPRRQDRSLHPHRAAAALARAEQQGQELLAAGAGQPCDAEDLAACGGEGSRRRAPRRAAPRRTARRPGTRRRRRPRAPRAGRRRS